MGCCSSKKDGPTADAKKPAGKPSQEVGTLLKEGKAGSVGLSLGPDMEVTALAEGGAAESSGVKEGDIVVLVTTKSKKKGKKHAPTPNRFKFLESVGPQNEVFEGTQITITVIREPEAQTTWKRKKPTPPGKSKREVQSWVDAVHTVNVKHFDMKVKAETDGVRKTRLKKIEAIKQKKNITKMDVNLVDAFMSDPKICEAYTRKIFNKADTNRTGYLSRTELRSVFNEMAEVTGCPRPAEVDLKHLFHVMDTGDSDSDSDSKSGADGKLSFDEMFPYFRSYQIRQIAKLLDS